MKRSLGKKIVAFIIVIAVLLSGTCIIVSGVVNRRTMDNEYLITADSMAATVAVTIDGDKMKTVTDQVLEIYDTAVNRMSTSQRNDPNYIAYTRQYRSATETPEYYDICAYLRSIQDVSEADHVYAIYVVPEEKTAVYIVDGAYGDAFAMPGSFYTLDASCYPYLGTPDKGLPAFITDTGKAGWAATSCAPVYDSSGSFVCFAAVDLYMNDVLTTEKNFLLMLGGILIILTLIICVIAIIFVRRKIVRPINMLSKAAAKYGQKKAGSAQSGFGSLDIRTGDEIEILHRSMVQMEKDIDSYIDSLTKTEQQSDDMHEQ